MNYKLIKEKLDNLGLLTYIRKSTKGEFIFSGIPDKKTLMKANYSFNLYLKNDIILIQYFIGQLVVEKEFKTIEELLEFVKEVFPIEK